MKGGRRKRAEAVRKKVNEKGVGKCQGEILINMICFKKKLQGTSNVRFQLIQTQKAYTSMPDDGDSVDS